jgi:histidinol-phosphate aminotransferase
MSEFLSKRLSGLKPYLPGEQPTDKSYIKLNTNESPFAPSKRVLAAIDKQQIENLRLYPDPRAKELTKAIADCYGVDAAQVAVGNGSDELLAFCFLAFCDDRQEICFPDPTYGFYEVYCALLGLKINKIPLRGDLSINCADYLNAGKNIIIANPNAPTGISLDPKEIESILNGNRDHIVIVDEAYIDFGGQSCLPLLKKYKNLAVVRTFSKSRSLAGGRIGFMIASEEIIADIDKIKYSFNPYNVSRLSLVAARAAVEDADYFERCKNKIISAREFTAQQLKKLGFACTDSKANFIFCTHPDLGGGEYYRALKERGILVRHFDGGRVENYVRITIGLDADMLKLVEETKKILKS